MKLIYKKEPDVNCLIAEDLKKIYEDNKEKNPALAYEALETSRLYAQKINQNGKRT